VAAALSGDQEAVRRLLRRMNCVRGMVRYQSRRLGANLRPDELEDLVQTTLLAVWKRLDTYTGAGRLEAWIFRFTYLETLVRIRAAQRAPKPIEAEYEIPAPDPAPTLGIEDHAHLYRTLDRLKPDARDIVLLKHVEGLTFEEIGTHRGVPVNTAKTRYYRALAALRGLLASRAADLDPGGER